MLILYGIALLFFICACVALLVFIANAFEEGKPGKGFFGAIAGLVVVIATIIGIKKNKK
jgi:amino acid permease